MIRFPAPRATFSAVAIATLALSSSAASQIDPAIEARIDSLFSEWARPGSPGAVVGVVREGRLAFARGYGLAVVRHGVPIAPDTPFHVASESKQFTAAAILILAERGTIDLDDDVRQWIPEVPDFGETITIRHLLNHASGLRDQWQALALAGRHDDDAIESADVLRMVERQRDLNFPPGERELYSNTGYTLLAEVVARASGRPFAEFARSEIFEPLEMRDTRFLDDLREIVPRAAQSYGVAGSGGFERRILSYAVPGATSLWTTVEDLAKWLADLDRPTLADYGPLYVRDTLDDGTEVLWGYGMNVGEYAGRRRLGHGGGDAGFRAWSVRFPEDDLGLIVLANLESINPGPFGNALSLQVADLFLDPRPAPLAAPVADPDPGPDLDTLVGSYRSGDGRLLNVTNEYGVLNLWDPAGEEKTALEPVEGTTFGAIGSTVRVGFEGGDAEPASAIRISEDGGEWQGTRVDPVPPEGLAAYTGPWRSPELETTWTLVVEDGRLVARHLMHEDVGLDPVVRDLFEADAWFLREARFTRDVAGSVVGLRVSAGRIKNVRFERAETGEARP